MSTMSAQAGHSGSTSPPPPPSPPKVGVGVVILRHLKEAPGPEVLLIKRGKRPSLGMWSFCGGSLELGETMIECAAREAAEETGLTLRHRIIDSSTAIAQRMTAKKGLFLKNLDIPAVFAAVDVIEKDPDGSIAWHYAVVEVAALPENPRAEPVAGDDAADAAWFPASDLGNLENLVPNAIEVVEEALERFEIPIE